MQIRVASFILSLIFLVSCRGAPSAIERAGTMVAETVSAAPPTDTPLPSPTPLPSETPTPRPTATPDAGATTTAQASAVLSELSVSVGDAVDYQSGHLAWQQTEPVTIDMRGPSTTYQALDRDLTTDNFVLKSDVTWTASGLIFCGLIFRSEPDIERGKQYHFLYLRLSGAPAWAIEFHNFGQVQNSPSGVKFSDALDLDNGATNQFIMIANDNEFTLFLNNKRQGRFFDNSRQSSEGTFAFLGLQDSGEGSCRFENSWIWVLD